MIVHPIENCSTVVGVNGRITASMKRIALLVLVLSLGACGPFKLPRLPQRLDRPGATVSGVRLLEAGQAASRYAIDISLYNPNEVPLPVTFVEYRISIGGANYETDMIPGVTLPAKARITVSLPAVLVRGASQGGVYEMSGQFTITPAGEVRKLLYEIGIPKPKSRFSAQGKVVSKRETQGAQ
jgi:LEA14-like dessication related protein